MTVQSTKTQCRRSPAQDRLGVSSHRDPEEIKRLRDTQGRNSVQKVNTQPRKERRKTQNLTRIGQWNVQGLADLAAWAEKYIGCYWDSIYDRLLMYEARFSIDYEVKTSHYTRETCSFICTSRNYTYFGLEFKSECYCGNSYSKFGPRNESDCNTPCTGNSSEVCGGSLTMSLYSVCPAGYYGKECHTNCNCRNNSRCDYSSGACPSGCKPGWMGQNGTCNTRNCNENNGDCPEREACVRTNLKHDFVYRCMCASGYQRQRLWDDCIDIDECSLSPTPCDQETSTCINSIGDFQCKCKAGLAYHNKHSCIHEDLSYSRIMRHLNDSVQNHYIGCFYDIGYLPGVWSRSHASDILQCIQYCQRQTSLTYAGIMNGTLCSCRDEYGVQVSDDNCNLECYPKGKEACKGVVRYPTAYALFSVCPIGTHGSSCEKGCHCKRDLQCPRSTGICQYGCHARWTGEQCLSANLSEQYIGCFKDNRNARAMSVCVHCSEDDDWLKSIESCNQGCAKINLTYAGNQNSWQCHCGEVYDRYGPLSETSCNMTCSGNENETCGGEQANSVYSVCPVGHYGRLCAERCHCLDGGRCTYRNGSCLPTGTTCESGWKGHSCSIRDCDQNNGDCFSDEICYNIKLNLATITACRCFEGHRRKNPSENCTEFDECSLSPPPCDLSASTCTNTIGSFQCKCNDGYTQNSTTLCIDIDECQRSTARCEAGSTTCINTHGGYECSCKPGHIRIDQYTCRDIDECTSEICDMATTKCVNTLGSFHCDCQLGYDRLNGSLCEDIDECQLSLALCDTRSTICNNNEGGYKCKCKLGYTRKHQYICKDPGYSVGVMVGASLGSAFGIAVLLGIAVAAAWSYKRKRRIRRRLSASADRRASEILARRLGSVDYYNGELILQGEEGRRPSYSRYSLHQIPSETRIE